MFDIGWQELFLIAVLALIVVGPKDLPRALKTVMKGVRKIRGLATEFQSGVDDLAREADIDEIKKNIEGSDDQEIERQIRSTFESDDGLRDQLELSDFNDDFDDVEPGIHDANSYSKINSVKKTDTPDGRKKENPVSEGEEKVAKSRKENNE